MIERKSGIYAGCNKSSAYTNLVWTIATSSDTSLGVYLEGGVLIEVTVTAVRGS